MYTDKNFKTKKALVEDVKAYAAYLAQKADLEAAGPGTVGAVLLQKLCAVRPVGVHQPGGMFPGKTDGQVCIEGPHYPESHRWYATATIKDSVIVKVK